MKITGSYMLDAPREQVWPLLFDPSTLLQAIPGCEQIEAAGPDEYHGRVNLHLAAVGGQYDTSIKMLEQVRPSHCRMSGEASGASGSVRGQAVFNLQEAEPGTLVTYEGEAVITGPLSGMNSRFIEGVAQTLVRQSLGRLNAQLQSSNAAQLPAATTAPDQRGGRISWPRRAWEWVMGLWGHIFRRAGVLQGPGK
jgi:hypothetical protein